MQRSYPEIFFELLETITCDLLLQNLKTEKISPLKNLINFLKALTDKLLILKNKRRDFYKSLQMVSCTATE